MILLCIFTTIKIHASDKLIQLHYKNQVWTFSFYMLQLQIIHIHSVMKA